jgi:2-phosphosulfolactate phosphatase
VRVEVADFVAGARDARGSVVIIDVFRATSTAAYAFGAGAARVLPVAAIADAFALRTRYPQALLAGERHARRLPGFDAGNSPTDLSALDLEGATLVHTTHAGTQGLAAAVSADEVITAAFVNVSAVAAYLRLRAPPLVTLVRMGHEARERCVEDDLCATCLAALLDGRDAGLSEVRERLRDAPTARKFFDPACDYAPEADFDRCTDVDRFGFVLRLRRNADAVLELARLDPPWSVA